MRSTVRIYDVHKEYMILFTVIMLLLFFFKRHFNWNVGAAAVCPTLRRLFWFCGYSAKKKKKCPPEQ